jgi:hypothetical protein
MLMLNRPPASYSSPALHNGKAGVVGRAGYQVGGSSAVVGGGRKSLMTFLRDSLKRVLVAVDGRRFLP